MSDEVINEDALNVHQKPIFANTFLFKLNYYASSVLSLRIDRDDVRLFLTVLSISTVVWGIFIFNFLVGNHDVEPILHRQMEDITWMGRFLFYPLNLLLTQNYFLPVISPVVCLIALSIGAILFCKYFELTGKYRCLLVCLTLTLAPFHLADFYYFSMVAVCVPFAFVMAAFYLSKFYLSKLSLLVSALFIYAALGAYNVFFNQIATLIVLTVLWEIYKGNNLLNQGFKRLSLRITLAVIGGTLLYLFNLYVYRFFGLSVEFYNNTLLGPDQILANFGKIAFENMRDWTASQPPFLPGARVCLLFTSALAALVLTLRCFKGNFNQRLLNLNVLMCSVLFLIFGHNLIAFVSPAAWSVTGEWNGRIIWRSMGVTISFALIVLLTAKVPLLKLGSLLVGFTLAWLFALSCAQAQLIWKISFDKELLFRNRVLARIEMQSAFDPAKHYNYIQIGSTPEFGRVFTTGYNRGFLELQRPFEAPHSIGQFYFLITDELRPDNITVLRAAPHNFNPTAKALCQKYGDWLRNNAQAWPSPNSVLVTEDTIFLVLNQQELKQIVSIINKN